MKTIWTCFLPKWNYDDYFERNGFRFNFKFSGKVSPVEVKNKNSECNMICIDLPSQLKWKRIN